MQVQLDAVLRRLTFAARGLGFVFLVYFIPAVIRDVAGTVLPGGGFVGLLEGAGDPVVPAMITMVTFAVSAAFVLLYARAGEEAVRPARLLRLDRPWFSEWGRGFLLGAALATAVVGPLLATGAFRVTAFRAPDRPDLLVATIVTLLLEAAREELGFRGPSQRDLTTAVGFPLAAVFLAGSFTIIHAGNPQIGRDGLLGIFLAGLALAGLARARGDVGMACGVHAGWNVFTGMVWSVPLSGYRLEGALLVVEPAASSPWTGGTFGIEASLPGILAFLVLGFIAWRLPDRWGSSGERSGNSSPDPGTRDR